MKLIELLRSCTGVHQGMQGNVADQSAAGGPVTNPQFAKGGMTAGWSDAIAYAGSVPIDIP